MVQHFVAVVDVIPPAQPDAMGDGVASLFAAVVNGGAYRFYLGP